MAPSTQVCEMAADPYRRGHRVERNADAPALQVLGRLNASLAIDVDIAVAKHACGKYRQRHERAIAAR